MFEIFSFHLIDVLFIVFVLNFILTLRIYPTKMNPSSMYSFGFAVASFLCIVFRDKWDMNSIRVNTFILLLIGVLSFTLFSYLFVLNGNTIKNNKVVIKRFKELSVDTLILWFFLVVQIIVLVLRYRFVMTTTGLLFLSDALANIRDASNSGDAYKIPRYLQWAIEISDILSYYFGFVFAKMMVNNEKGIRRYLCASIFIVGTLASFFNGARGMGLYFVAYYFIIWGLLSHRKNYMIISPLGLKRVIRIVVITALIVPLFNLLSSGLGRGEKEYQSPLYGLGVYCGAEFKNLDIFLNEPMANSKTWGEYTFRRYDMSQRIERLKYLQPTNFVRGDFIGNVGSCVQFYYQDFNYVGVVVLVGLMAFIMHFLYRYSIKTRVLEYKNFSYIIFLFAYLGRGVVFSFFSERFYEQFMFSLVTIRLLILIAVLSWFIERNSVTKQNKIKLKYGIKQ